MRHIDYSSSGVQLSFDSLRDEVGHRVGPQWMQAQTLSKNGLEPAHQSQQNGTAAVIAYDATISPA